MPKPKVALVLSIGLGCTVLTGAGLFVLAKAIRGHTLCGMAQAEATRWTSLQQRTILIENGEHGVRDPFSRMMKSGALFRARLREPSEMATDLSEALKESGLAVSEVTLVGSAPLPASAPEGEQIWTGNLALTEFLTFKPGDTFFVRAWTAKVSSAKPEDTEVLFKKWAADDRQKSPVAIKVTGIQKEGDGTLRVSFEAGMIPAMALPHRVMPMVDPALPDWQRYGIAHKSWPDALVKKHCIAKAIELTQKTEAILNTKAGTGKNNLLEQFERSDRVHWMVDAEKHSSHWLQASDSDNKTIQSTK